MEEKRQSNTVLRKMLALMVSSVMIFSLAAIPSETSLAQTSESAQEQDDAVLQNADSMQERLSKLDGVVKVEKLDLVPAFQQINAKYMVYFEQPLDWDHPEKGTFVQRVEVGIRNNAEVNAFHTNGYSIDDMVLKLDIDPENLTSLLNANYFHAEHRFFGGSRPEGMKDDNSNFEEWYPYFNLKASTADLHKIYKELSKIFGKDKWIAFGRSYNGEMTNAYAYYYPDDMACYLPFCAPCSSGNDNENFYKNVYEKIGNDRKDGPEMRKLITDFQVELMRNKKALLPLYKKALRESKGTYTAFATPERLFDMHVLEFAVQMWQVSTNQTLTLGKNVKELFPEVTIKEKDTADQKKAKLEKQMEILTKIQTFDWATNTFFFPYYVSAFTELGQYHYNFQYLRDAMQKAEVPLDNLSVTPEAEATFCQDLVFTPKQKALFTYDDTFHKGIAADIKTTNTKHMMIFGADDPWTAIRIPINNGENPNVKVYILPQGDHSTVFKLFPENVQKEILDQLKDWLGVKKDQPGSKAEYEVAAGADAEWVQGSKGGLEFTFKRIVDGAESDTYQHFNGLLVDNNDVVSGRDYEIREGSVIVTLKPEFLEKLESGNHEVKALFDDDGEAVADFKISSGKASGSKASSAKTSGKGDEKGNVVATGSSNLPKTADSATSFVYVTLFIFMVASAVLLRKHRKKHIFPYSKKID